MRGLRFGAGAQMDWAGNAAKWFYNDFYKNIEFVLEGSMKVDFEALK